MCTQSAEDLESADDAVLCDALLFRDEVNMIDDLSPLGRRL